MRKELPIDIRTRKFQGSGFVPPLALHRVSRRNRGSGISVQHMRQERESRSTIHHPPGFGVLTGLQVAVKEEVRRMRFEENIFGEMHARLVGFNGLLPKSEA